MLGYFLLFLFTSIPLLRSEVSAYEIEQVSESPRIYVIRGFLSEEECDYLISYARPHLKRSVTVNLSTGEVGVDPGRTSTSMFCPDHHGDSVLLAIENRLSDCTAIEASYAENIQIAHYSEGEKFGPHHDYFDPSTPGGELVYRREGQRVASFLMYLNTPEKGGETAFPLLNFSMTPVKGDALLFYNVDFLGRVDPLTLHAGMPVLAGEKWLATRWFRDMPFTSK